METQTIANWVDQLASKAAVPGGGGASALAGALGAALGAMAANLTIGKKKYADVQAEMARAAQQLTQKAGELLSGMEADAQAFAPLAKAYGMPSYTQQEKDEKQRVLQRALKEATQPPMQLIRTCLSVTEILQELSEKASRLVISDVGCGAAMCRACLQAAALNVYINARMIQDEAIAQDMFAWTQERVGRGSMACDAIVEKVEAALCRR